MNIDKFKNQHVEILDSIFTLRKLVHGGISENATAIARGIVSMSGVIKLHLSVEDSFLYPALEASGNRSLTNMSQRYRAEMDGIASEYLKFAASWNTAKHIVEKPEAFRSEANHVLKILHDRIKKENTEFYPAIELSTT